MKKTTSPGIHLVKSKGKFFWRLMGKNGKELTRSSEVYNSKQGCVKSIKAAQKVFSYTDCYFDWTGNNGVVEKWIK
jgi:uncharacterized protein YegP (UPF0339 family)